MTKKKATAPKPAAKPAAKKEKQPAPQQETAEGVEKNDPEGVVTTEQETQKKPEPEEKPAPAKGKKKYVVQWDLKLGGDTLTAGDEVTLTNEEAAQFAGSQVIKPKE